MIKSDVAHEVFADGLFIAKEAMIEFTPKDDQNWVHESVGIADDRGVFNVKNSDHE